MDNFNIFKKLINKFVNMFIVLCVITCCVENRKNIASENTSNSNSQLPSGRGEHSEIKDKSPDSQQSQTRKLVATNYKAVTLTPPPSATAPLGVTTTSLSAPSYCIGSEAGCDTAGDSRNFEIKMAADNVVFSENITLFYDALSANSGGKEGGK